MTAEDYAHVIIACLTHDIGYVRGLFKATTRTATSSTPPGASRRCRAVHRTPRCCPIMSTAPRCSRWSASRAMPQLDKHRIACAIEGTRFPSSLPSERGGHATRKRLLLRAADLIGQLGDPHYMRKANALYLRVRGGRPEPAARLLLARRPRQSLPAILLEQRRAADPDGDPLSQRHLQRTAMDRQPLQQRVPRRARHRAVGPAEVKLAFGDIQFEFLVGQNHPQERRPRNRRHSALNAM